MKPIRPLMREHQFIERMIALLKDELSNIVETGKTDDHFLDAVIEFFGVHADRCHHAKEQDILFRELKTKPLSAEHKAT
jgi:hemerythrin-like domain-containing protein